MAGESQIFELDWDSIGDQVGGAGLRDLMRDIHRGFHSRAVIAETNQALAAKHFQKSRVGPHGMRRDMVVDNLNFHYWSVREGLECWHDDQFCDETKRDVPGAAVNATSGKTTISVGGGR